jgi:hypothetical protein
MRLGQRAAESRFEARYKELGGRRGRSELGGGIVIVRAGSARTGRQPDVLGALEVSSFAFVDSNQQRCERDRTIFVMVGPNFQATHVRWSGTPIAAVVDSEVPLGAT